MDKYLNGIWETQIFVRRATKEEAKRYCAPYIHTAELIPLNDTARRIDGYQSNVIIDRCVEMRLSPNTGEKRDG